MYFNYFPTFFLLNFAVYYTNILITKKKNQAHSLSFRTSSLFIRPLYIEIITPPLVHKKPSAIFIHSCKLYSKLQFSEDIVFYYPYITEFICTDLFFIENLSLSQNGDIKKQQVNGATDALFKANFTSKNSHTLKIDHSLLTSLVILCYGSGFLHTMMVTKTHSWDSWSNCKRNVQFLTSENLIDLLVNFFILI